MGRQSRPQTGEAMPQGRPMGAAFRAREFRRSASLTWDCEGFETDNLARQSAGMRRAATLPHGSTTHSQERTMSKLLDQKPATASEARLLRFARNDVDGLVEAVIARSAQRDEAISAT